MTRTFDRGAELEACGRVLLESGWLTLVGPSGVGKTRLALRLAETMEDPFPDGRFFVDVEGLASEEDAVARAAAAVGVAERGAGSLADALVARLREARALLVLDHGAGGDATAVASRRACVATVRAWRCSPRPRAPSAATASARSRCRRSAIDRSRPRRTWPPARPRRSRSSDARARWPRSTRRSSPRGGGAGRTLLLSGEAGAGKSRLMSELRNAASARGLVCLGGGCEYQSGLNFGPFVAALDELGRRFEGRTTGPLGPDEWPAGSETAFHLAARAARAGP